MFNILKESAKISAYILCILIGLALCFVALFYAMAGYVWTPLAVMAISTLVLSCLNDIYPA